jgi:hypothetical protein
MLAGCKYTLEHEGCERSKSCKEREQKAATIAKKDYLFAIKLAEYPMPKVMNVPTTTHHVHGTFQCHRYNSMPNPNNIPTMAPR